MTTGLVRIEKETASIGLFVASRRSGEIGAARRIVITRTIQGQCHQSEITVLADPEHGLPTVEDQDRFLALQKILTEIHTSRGGVSNPVSFPNAALLRILNRNTESGRHHERIRRWLRRMSALRIRSEGAIRHAGNGTWLTRDLAIIERAATAADSRVHTGRGACNRVYLSSWFLENLNRGHVFRLDLDSYLELRHSIARVLAPILHVWLYASRRQGRFEKESGSLYQLLGLSPGHERWRIKARLTPAFEELRQRCYLSEWRFAIGRHGSKVVLFPGRKLSGRSPDNGGRPRPSDSLSSRALLSELLRRRIGHETARQLVRNLASGQDVLEQHEWGDHLIRTRSGIKNPAGFYIHLIRENIAPPEGFIRGRRSREDRDGDRTSREEAERISELESAYADYREKAIDRHISSHITPLGYEALLEQKRRELARRFPHISRWTAKSLDRCLRLHIASYQKLMGPPAGGQHQRSVRT